MTRRIDVNPNAPIINESGRASVDTVILLQEIAKMLRDLEARVEALESP